MLYEQFNYPRHLDIYASTYNTDLNLVERVKDHSDNSDPMVYIVRFTQRRVKFCLKNRSS